MAKKKSCNDDRHGKGTMTLKHCNDSPEAVREKIPHGTGKAERIPLANASKPKRLGLGSKQNYKTLGLKGHKR